METHPAAGGTRGRGPAPWLEQELEIIVVIRGVFTALALCLVGMVHAAPTPDRQAELRALLAQDCGACHGLSRRGGLGPALLPGSLAGRSDAALVEVILDGRPGTPMPPWRGLLSEDEVRWLVGVLREGPGP